MAAGGGEKRGLLKPKLSWPGAKAGAKPLPPKGGAPSNAVPLAQYNLAQLQQMASSRGLSVEKLVAQMVQQYLKEQKDDAQG